MEVTVQVMRCPSVPRSSPQPRHWRSRVLPTASPRRFILTADNRATFAGRPFTPCQNTGDVDDAAADDDICDAFPPFFRASSAFLHLRRSQYFCDLCNIFYADVLFMFSGCVLNVRCPYYVLICDGNLPACVHLVMSSDSYSAVLWQ